MWVGILLNDMPHSYFFSFAHTLYSYVENTDSIRNYISDNEAEGHFPWMTGTESGKNMTP